MEPKNSLQDQGELITPISKKVLDYIKFASNKISCPSFEKEDIQQEILVSIIEYCNSTEPEKRSMGAINNVVNRTIYRIIRDNATFDTLSEKSKIVRKNIANPMPLKRFSYAFNESESYDDGFDRNTVPQNMKVKATQLSQIEVDSFVSYFKNFLTVCEATIFDFMLLGLTKPRMICREMYGEYNSKKAKTISKHMVNIRIKFAEKWSEENGH